MTAQPNIGIKVSVMTRDGEPPANPFGADFGPDGGTIGSAAGNVLVLPDDSGTVATHHADMHCATGSWRMRNISERGALTVNGRPLSPGADVSVGAGDFIGIGVYVLRITSALGAPDAQSGAAAVLADNPPFPAARDTGVQEHNETDPLANAPTAGWLSDRSTQLGRQVSFGELAGVPVDPLALFSQTSSTLFGAHNPHPAELFVEDLSPREAARSRMTRQRETTALDHLLAVRGATLVPADHDAGTRLGRDRALMTTPGGAGAFGLQRMAWKPNHAATADTSVAAHDASSRTPATEHESVPMKVHYGANLGIASLAIKPATIVETGLDAEPHPVSTDRISTPVDDPFAVLRASFPASDDTVPTIERATRGSIDITTEQKSRTADLKEDSAPALMQAFFEGAGISPLDAAQAGFDTEFMRALGALARTLIAKRPG